MAADEDGLLATSTCTDLPMTLSEGEFDSVKKTSSWEPSSMMVTSSQCTALFFFRRTSNSST